MPLSEYLKTHSHRDHKTLIAWLDNQWNNPDRHDHYLMQVALEVKRVLSSKPNDYKLSDCKIPFITNSSASSSRELSEEELKQRTEYSKSIWIAGVGGEVREEFVSINSVSFDSEESGLKDPPQ